VDLVKVQRKLLEVMELDHHLYYEMDNGAYGKAHTNNVFLKRHFLKSNFNVFIILMFNYYCCLMSRNFRYFSFTYQVNSWQLGCLLATLYITINWRRSVYLINLILLVKLKKTPMNRRRFLNRQSVMFLNKFFYIGWILNGINAKLTVLLLIRWQNRSINGNLVCQREISLI
jgi:hypothetical protein